MSKVHFEKLTPVKDIELNIYGEALDFVFNNNDIINVAITGAYSAGKSSVIESYKQKYKEVKFLHISLANFVTTDKESLKIESNKQTKENRGYEGNNDNDTNNKKSVETSYVKESILEGKVLNQLLHQIEVSKIPQTNFRIKQQISNKHILCVTLITMIFFISILHIRFYTDWCNFVGDLSSNIFFEILSVTTKEVSLFFSGSIIIGAIGLAIYNLIKIQINKNMLKRFKFQGNEIEIFDKNDESYFDKYLNEVIYLFDNSDVDVIVFEDMDRYNINQIFQRLREVNTLVNNKRKRNSKKPLRFFYLLRDDVFISKDRTKFFDFIMPVVPVIDSSNAYDQFIIHLKKGKIFEKFDEHFLQGISLYVDDMRILKNIYNEFMIYNDRVSTTEQDYNKLLAIIVYKNIFPRDFSDTQLNKGFVSTLFHGKDEIIKDEIDKIDEKIEEIKNKVELCNKEYLQNSDELNNTYSRTSWGGNRYVDTNSKEYIDRKERIELIEKDQVVILELKIKELENEKVDLKNKNIQDIIKRENIDKIFNISYKNFLDDESNFEDIKVSNYFDLIKYLIRDGHIDETYEDYMTYFYPNSLTRNDKIYLRSVTDKKKKEWDYSIDNAQLVISRLREKDFDEIETLNYDLFEYLLKTESINKKYLSRLIKQLRKNKKIMFMEGYFKIAKDLSIFVKIINQYWSSFLSEIFYGSEFSYDQKKEYILITLYHCDREHIDIINKDNFLFEAISSDIKFLNIESPRVEKLITEFLSLNIKFKRFDYEKSHKGLFNSVYQNKLYELTFENISLVLEKIYNVQNEIEIQHKNYSLIISDSSSKLYEYVEENINEYIKVILDSCGETITDSPQAVLKLINNKDVNSNKDKYLEYLQTQIELLEGVKDLSLWDSFLKKKLVKYSEENILQYYFKSGRKLNEVLVDFINSNISNLQFSISSINEVFGENSASVFFDDMIICETLRDDRYRKILSSIKYRYDKFNIEKISEGKMQVLIELGIIKMTTENVVFMRKVYESKFIYFLESNIEEFLNNIIDVEPIKYEELIDLLETNICDDFKEKLIANTNRAIPIISTTYSNNLKKYILKNNFDESELPLLINDYVNLGNTIGEELKHICAKYINNILEEKVELPLDIFEYLIQSSDITDEDKLVVLTTQIDKLSKEECNKYLEVIGSKEHKKLLGTGRPKLEATEINKELLEKIESKNWIASFSEDNGIFKISRRQVNNKLETALL